MPKQYKLLIVDSISIEVDEKCQAKDISRVRMKIFQQGNPSISHTTKQYAEINENELHWSENFEFRYTGQTKITFETYCEHEYGYNLQQLQVLYRGVYFLKNQMFFKKDSCHIYSPDGQKKGLLRWQLKVVNREELDIREEKALQIKPLVREDLIGLFKIYQAKMEIINPIFNKKKNSNLQLKIMFGQQVWINQEGVDFCWKFPSEVKIQYIIQGKTDILFQLNNEDKVLQGSISCENIARLKRYSRHRVSLFNKNGIKIGSLILQSRFIEKQELLDLLYSPNSKLTHHQQPHMDVTDRSKASQLSPQQILPQHAFLHKSSNKLPSKKYTSFFHEPSVLPKDRYKIGYLMNSNSDILIPKATRFSNQKGVNPRVSYIDPEKISDFSPKSKKGWDMSKGTKFDFTRQFKNNPGVGSYKLPSIWSKY